MKGYIIKYNNDLVCITNNPKKWLKENNKNRMTDNQEVESLYTFRIIETELFVYKEKKKNKSLERFKEV